MAEITINGVKYTNVPNKKAGTKFAASLTQSNIGASQAVQDYVNSSYFYPLVNAIDINWNGVEVDENSYINSTSDLITYIATKGSNVDLTSYATKNYVDQKIEDVVGGAPETLDTLKELADALANDATLSYVTEALDGKADKSSLDDYATVAYVTTELEKKANLSDIPSAPDLTPYATVSYVTEELDKKVDISDMPVIPDMANYVTYTYANSHYTPLNDHIIHRLKDTTNGVDIAYLTKTGRINNIGNIIKKCSVDSSFTKSSDLLIISNLYGNNISIGGSDSIIGGARMNANGTSYTFLSNGIFIGTHSKIGRKNFNQDTAIESGLFIGDYLTANWNNQYILGRCNTVVDNNNGNFNDYNTNTTLFAIGNGEYENNRHNAFEVYRNGKVWIADTYNSEPYVLQSKLVHKSNIDALKNVNISDVQDGQVLAYSGTQWINTNINIPDMTNYATQSDVSSAFGSLQDIVEHDYATVSYVTTELENKADASDIPDMTNYVDVTSYNALYAEVQHLAYLISYYHPSSPDPGPGPDPDPGQQFEGYWTLNGVRTDSITLSESDSPVTLSFVSNPTIASGIGTWTFHDIDPNVTINTSTGEMTINPSLIGAGTVYRGAGYLYEHGEYSTSFNITITITAAASKGPATGYFVDGNNNQINTPLAWTDEGGELDEQAFTLVSDPASGWTGPVVSYTSNELHSGQDYTINGNTITFANIQSPPNVSTFAWSYAGDSLYDMGSVELKVVGLQYGADTQFFPDCGNSSTVEIPAGTDVFGFNIINRTGIDYVQHPISVSSDNQNVTVTNGITSDSFTITNTSTGTNQYATITATITEGNDTHTTSFDINFLPSQPTQEYTNVSILYEVPVTQATNLPQGTFDTNPFEVGNADGVGMGSTLIANVEFSGPEYDMNNFNTDFVLTRDTSYAGNYSTVTIPQYPISSIYNTYSNGVNTITFNINIYAAGSESGTNRDVLTFTHNGYNYLTDGIKTHAEAGAPT